MTTENTPRVTQADLDAYDDLMSDDLYDHPPHAAGYFARHREAAEAAAKAREAELVHIAADLLQHLDWLTSGLPALLENGGLTDEEGLIGAAVDAANSARATLARHKAGTEGGVA